MAQAYFPEYWQRECIGFPRFKTLMYHTYFFIIMPPVGADATSPTAVHMEQQPSYPSGGAQSHPPNQGNAATCLWYTVYMHSRMLGMNTNHVDWEDVTLCPPSSALNTITLGQTRCDMINAVILSCNTVGYGIIVQPNPTICGHFHDLMQKLHASSFTYCQMSTLDYVMNQK